MPKIEVRSSKIFRNIHVSLFGCLLSYAAFKTLEMHSQTTKIPPPLPTD